MISVERQNCRVRLLINLKIKEHTIKMKGMENFGDIIAMGIGMFGAFLKGMKKKLKIPTIILACIIAGILTYSVTGVIEIFYHDATPKIVILISFIVGWISNELVTTLDNAVGDLYEIGINYLKQKFNKGGKK